MADPIGTSLFNAIEIKHGPTDLLRNFFELAEINLGYLGVHLRLTTLATTVATQEENQDSWRLFPPMLSTRWSHIRKDESFGIVGVTADGNPVTAQGGRLYDIGERTLTDIVQDQSFNYGTEIPPKEGLPRSEVTTPIASTVTGRFMYSGAIWVHPDMRRHGLPAYLARIGRCYALGMWNTEHNVGMVRENVKLEHVRIYGYKRVEPRFTYYDLDPNGDALHWQLMVMNRQELVEDLRKFMTERK